MLKTFFVKTKTKTKICVFVLEAPRDQNLGHEDYITLWNICGCDRRDISDVFCLNT